MFTKKNVSRVAAALVSLVMCGTAVAAGTASSTLTVNATLESACAVSSAATISFGTVSTLDTADVTANSGGTFTVACSSDMTPKIFATGTRAIGILGAATLPFKLSLDSTFVAADLATTGSPGDDLGITQDGTDKTVILYARLAKTDFNLLPAGVYTTNGVTVSVSY